MAMAGGRCGFPHCKSLNALHECWASACTNTVHLVCFFQAVEGQAPPGMPNEFKGFCHECARSEGQPAAAAVAEGGGAEAKIPQAAAAAPPKQAAAEAAKAPKKHATPYMLFSTQARVEALKGPLGTSTREKRELTQKIKDRWKELGPESKQVMRVRTPSLQAPALLLVPVARSNGTNNPKRTRSATKMSWRSTMPRAPAPAAGTHRKRRRWTGQPPAAVARRQPPFLLYCCRHHGSLPRLLGPW
jgi:hypothetical protein